MKAQRASGGDRDKKRGRDENEDANDDDDAKRAKFVKERLTPDGVRDAIVPLWREPYSSQLMKKHGIW